MNNTDNNTKGNFLVFHSTNRTHPLQPNAKLWHEEIIQIAQTGITEKNPNRNFQLVALVSNATPEEVFELTQHLENPWQQNPEVIAFTHQPRSTSVGDVIFRVGETNLKKALMVGHFHYIDLSKIQEGQYTFDTKVF
jgi:Zn-dependent metalloprotease